MMPHETTAGGAIIPGPIDFAPLSRHEKVGLLFSGGKDALVLLLLFRKHLHRLTVYHLDTGDTDPEIRTIVDAVEAKVPRFVRIRSDVRAWIAANGPPSDLIPASCCGADLHLHHGRAGRFPIMHPNQCCNANRWEPLQQRLDADGITLTIDGTRKADNAYGWYVARPGSSPHPHSRVPLGSSVEQWLPIEDWSDADVFAYLRSVGAPMPKMYDYGAHGGDCARCPAFWDSCKAKYLGAEHPALAAEWAKDISAIRQEIARPLAELDAELAMLDATSG